MKYNETKKTIPWLGFFSILVMICGLSMGCVVHQSYDNGGPPPWAPAHGYRAKYQYRYYPSVFVYFDITRNLYFYQEKGKWKREKSYPSWIHLGKDGFVHLEMDTDKPYKFHSAVKKRYPPGYHSNNHKGKEKDRDEWRGDRDKDEGREKKD